MVTFLGELLHLLLQQVVGALQFFMAQQQAVNARRDLVNVGLKSHLPHIVEAMQAFATSTAWRCMKPGITTGLLFRMGSMYWDTFSYAVGGLAIFLLAMLMMTEGLQTFGGGGLKRLLGRWTSSPLRGVGAGILVTAVVQSSSAVTVATIGFVNAGLLNLRQALGVIYGTNVGTTMTAWLVSLVGFGFDIDAFALPIVAAGVALRLLSADQRYRGLGDALTGFGLFFLGLDLLQQAFSGAAASFGAEALGGGMAAHWALALAMGFVVTLLTQSSSASVALILTATTGGLIDLPTAAAAIIGANVGTTTTAALAAIKATAAARRLALAHVSFNLVTGVVALLILPLMLMLIDVLARMLGISGNNAAFLALFHTVFNVLGVALHLPFVRHIATWLERWFGSASDDLAQPQHLDHTLARSPALALGAVRTELPRLQHGLGKSLDAALKGQSSATASAEAAAQLATAITEFIASLRAERMPRDVSDALTLCLRATRYLDEAAGLTASAQRLASVAQSGQSDHSDAHPPAPLLLLLEAASACVHAQGRDASAAALQAFERQYQATKTAVLTSVVAHQTEADEADALLDDMSLLRRLVQQWAKAHRVLAEVEDAAAPLAAQPSMPAL